LSAGIESEIEGAAPDKRASLQSVERAFAVLDYMVRRSRPVRASELANALSVDRAIIYRIMRTLIGEGFVEKTASGGYAIGARALIFGNAYRDRAYTRTVALPYMADFARTLAGKKQMVSMAVVVGSETLLIDQVWRPDTSLDFVFEAGSRLPVDETAAGRALLAYMAPDEAIGCIGERRWHELHDRFETIRAQGGLEIQVGMGHLHGQTAIACAILPRAGRPRTAIVLSGLGLDDQATPDSPAATQVRRYARLIGDAFTGD